MAAPGAGRGRAGAGRLLGRGEPRGTVNLAMYDNFFARDVTRVPAGTRVRVNNPGVYRFYCTFHSVDQGRQGMAAILVVGDVTWYPGQETTQGPPLQPVRRASGRTIRVPEDHRTIQAAVAAARPGDLVLVGPGVYREEVKVTTIGYLTLLAALPAVMRR